MENLKSQIKFMQEIEAKEAIEEAEEQAKLIIKNAEEEAERIKKQKTKEILEELQEKEASDMQISVLNQKRRISNVRYQLIDKVFSEAVVTLEKISNNLEPEYKTSLKKLILEAAKRIQGYELEILVNSRDRKFLEGKLNELRRTISKEKNMPIVLKISEEELNAQGGVIVRDKDRRQIFNNTFEARLAEARQEMIGKISESLFEGLDD